MFSHAILVFKSLFPDSLRQHTGLCNPVLAFSSVANEPGGLGEEFLHFLQGQLFCLREHGPKEDSIGEIADLV